MTPPTSRLAGQHGTHGARCRRSAGRGPIHRAGLAHRHQPQHRQAHRAAADAGAGLRGAGSWAGPHKSGETTSAARGSWTAGYLVFIIPIWPARRADEAAARGGLVAQSRVKSRVSQQAIARLHRLASQVSPRRRSRPQAAPWIRPNGSHCRNIGVWRDGYAFYCVQLRASPSKHSSAAHSYLRYPSTRPRLAFCQCNPRQPRQAGLIQVARQNCVTLHCLNPRHRK